MIPAGLLWKQQPLPPAKDEGFRQTIEINDITPGDAIGAGNGNARFTAGNQMITPTGHPQPLAGIDDIRRLKPIGFCKAFRARAGEVTNSTQRVPRSAVCSVGIEWVRKRRTWRSPYNLKKKNIQN